MKKKKAPATPTESPYTKQFGDISNRLANFDFSGNLSPLADTINLNPDMTRLALQSAQGYLQPQFRDTLNQINQNAANAGALQSSTFTDALTKAGSDLNSQYQSIASNAALNDKNRAMQNRISLFGTGLTGLGSAGSQENSFNLQNYENQLAKWSYDKSQLGPWGQVASFLSPVANDYFKSQGYTNVPGYGTQDIMSMYSGGSGTSSGSGDTSTGMQKPGFASISQLLPLAMMI